MAIPLLFIGAAVASGSFGVGKSIKAGIDQKKANYTNDEAESIVKRASQKLDNCRKNCGKAIDNLGSCKINILDNSIKPFINEFEKLNHVELTESAGLNELQKMVLDKKSFTELKALQSMATSMAGGLASGALAGAITAFGAYGAVGALATASTGTAISALGGAAATNATLAFFGGGSLAAGGLGMAGGTAVLGGLVAGPALAVLGLVVGAKASQNVDKAYSNLANAKEFRAELNTASSLCIGIRKRTNMFSRFLLSLNSVFEPLIYQMTEIIKKRGTDFRDFTDDEKKTVAEAMALAGAIKSVLDTPILDDDGNLTPESEVIVESAREKLEGAESTAIDRIEVFNDTLDWINSDPYLSASIPDAKEKTTVFYEDDYPEFDPSQTKEMQITVSGDRSFQAAMRLHKENPESKIAVMNFANAFHAGGGVTKGSNAQEESLCRTSTLYPLLYRRTLRDTFYKHHHDLNTPIASDSLIYTEGVIICKTDDDHPKRLPKEEWVTVDVITIAAPDLRKESNKYADVVNGGAHMDNEELFDCHVKRANHMLACAASKGADILVLGAFGCGAFQNDPEVVARAFNTVLKNFPRVFKKIEFAVYRPTGGSRNFDVFSKVLGNGADLQKISGDNVKKAPVKNNISLICASCADQTVDAVVNAANDRLWAGGGICGVIFAKAGMSELSKACAEIATPLNDGDAVITPAFKMKNAKAIIHAVGPNFAVKPTAFKELFMAYYNSLLVLKENGFHSISFPLISSGIFGGNLEDPVAESTKQCVRAYRKFVEDYPDYEINVFLCAYGYSEMEKAKKQFEEV